MADAKTHLITSNAGMRLIALLTIFNQGDFSRLGDYVTENFDPQALDIAPANARIAELRTIYRYAGKLRVEQVMGIGPYQAIVALHSERRGNYLAEITVSEDYPHQVLAYHLRSI